MRKTLWTIAGLLAAIALPASAVPDLHSDKEQSNLASPLNEESFDIAGLTRITADDGRPFELFGSSLGITHQHLVVGARWADNLRGAVYVFERIHPTDQVLPVFRQVARLSGSEEAHTFGWSVAINGLVVAVGAQGEKSGEGAAYLFDLATAGNGKPDGGGIRIPAPTGASFYGSAIALSEDTLVVATSRADNERGAAYVFGRPPGGWHSLDTTEFTKLAPSVPQHSSSFGWSVAIDGGTIFVGAPRYDTGKGEGAVFVFEAPVSGWGGGTQEPVATLTGPPNASFGTSLSPSGRLLAVGAPGKRDEFGTRTGTVLLFERPAIGWADPPGSPLATFTPSDPQHLAIFAWSVSMTGNAVLVGAPGDPVGGFKSPGAIYLFLEPESGWQDHAGHEAIKIVPPAGEMGDRFGFSLALDERTLFGGAITDTVADNPSQGSVYAYRIALPSVPAIPALGLVGTALLVSIMGLLGLRFLKPFRPRRREQL